MQVGGSKVAVLLNKAHQEGTQHVEAHEVEDCKVGSAGVLLPRLEVRLGVTQLARLTCQHDLLPGFPCGTPGDQKTHSHPRPSDGLTMGTARFPTHLKSKSTAWGKVWKLLLRLICAPSTLAILPKTWEPGRGTLENNSSAVQGRVKCGLEMNGHQPSFKVPAAETCRCLPRNHLQPRIPGLTCIPMTA